LAAGSSLDDRAQRGRRAQGRTVASGLAQSAPRAKASPRAPPAVRPARAGGYVVKPGDTLWDIATRFGTTVERLQRLNGLSRRQSRALRVGQAIAVKEEGA
ncbi:MAG TPA: LysM peptidoglycan-binding domain-containing protein, partial [Thermoanaerobaculia bacterium]|nr:LysM peptidoglycan-binding domain-containing protein [Thermoanaerobaculia bacterium]